MLAESGSPTEFEREVAHLFRIAGAWVEHNKEVMGGQVDVWAVEQTPTGAEFRIVVECKDLERPVGVHAVEALANRIHALRGSQAADAAIIVSRSGFSRQARNAGADHGVGLLSIEDLEYRTRGPSSVVQQDLGRVVLQAERLVDNVKEVLRSPDTLTTFELDGLHGDVAKVIEECRVLLERHRVLPPGDRAGRQAVGDVLRLEHCVDQLLDGLYYFRRVHDAIAEAANGLPPVGRTEADSAAAISIRLRDLEQARSHVRSRLNQVEERCRRLVVD